MGKLKKYTLLFVLVITLAFSSVVAYAGEKETTVPQEEVTKEETKTVKKLQKPVLLSAESHRKGIYVTWEPVENAVKYRVYRKQKGSGWSALGYVNDCDYLDKTAKKGKLYFYTVKAFGPKKLKSKMSKKGIAGMRLKTVKLVSVKNTGSAVKVQWNKVSSVTGYRVYRRIPGEDWIKLRDVKKSDTYLDTAAENGQTYEYAVISYKKSGKDKYLGHFYEAGMKTLQCLYMPELRKVAPTDNGLKVSWKKIPNVSKYKVLYKGAYDTKWQKLAVVEDNVYIDEAVSEGESRTYTVQAVAGKTKSKYNRTGVTGTYIPKTVFTSVKNDGPAVFLVWEAVDGVSGYRLYRKEEGGKFKKLADSVYTEFTDLTASDGTVYEYLISPYQRIGKKKKFGSKEDPKSRAVIMKLSCPMVTAEVTEGKGFEVKWNSINGAEKYQLMRKTAGRDWETIAEPKAEETSYIDMNVVEGLEYAYAVRAINGTYRSTYQSSKEVFIPSDIDLPEKRYLNLGWKVDPRMSGGPADYGSTTEKVNTKYWTNHKIFDGDTYTPHAGDIITYGTPDRYGNTQGHVDICVVDYDEDEGTFGVISGNWGSNYTTSPISYVSKSWKYYSSSQKAAERDRLICNIWECKLPETKKQALINSAYRMLAAYKDDPDGTRGKILECKNTNWCDVFVAYTIFIAK